jgi:hypothetical protein
MEGKMREHEQWQLTAEAAELYERYPARYILGPWAPLLVDAAALARGERVLDVACGPASWRVLPYSVSVRPGRSLGSTSIRE